MDEAVATALARLGQLVEAGGEGLPRGVRNSETQCPVARYFQRALGGNWCVRPARLGLVLEHDGDWWWIPATIESFVERFDDGHYPHLVAD